MLLSKKSVFAVIKGTFTNHCPRCRKPGTFMMAAIVLMFTLVSWNSQRGKEKTRQDPETRLSPKRLFSLLDLNTPGMEKVRETAQAANYTRAEEELLRYIRDRDNVNTSSLWNNRAKHEASYANKEEMTIADDALKHLFGGHPGDPERMFPAQQFGKDIDWRCWKQVRCAHVAVLENVGQGLLAHRGRKVCPGILPPGRWLGGDKSTRRKPHHMAQDRCRDKNGEILAVYLFSLSRCTIAHSEHEYPHLVEFIRACSVSALQRFHSC